MVLLFPFSSFQIKLKNTTDVGIFENLAFGSTEDNDTDHGSAKTPYETRNKEESPEGNVKEGEKEGNKHETEGKADDEGDDKKTSGIQPALECHEIMLEETNPSIALQQIKVEDENKSLQVNKEGSPGENLKEEEYAESEAEDDDGKVDMKTQSKVNAEDKKYEQKEGKTVARGNNGTKSKTDASKQHNIARQSCRIREEEPRVLDAMFKESEDNTHPSGSLGESKKSNEVSVIIESNVNHGHEKTQAAEEKELKNVEGNNEKKKNTSSDIRKTNKTTVKRENDGKKQPVVSTSAVPLIQFGHKRKPKEVFLPPESKDEETKPRGGEMITINVKSAEVKITIQHENEQHSEDDGDDDGITAKDLLCFAWQISEGMVSGQSIAGNAEKDVKLPYTIIGPENLH